MAQSSFTSRNLEDTVQFAQKSAETATMGDIITLQGPMGAGKSEFARAFIRHLMKNQTLDVPSPTFTLVQTYDTPHFPIWHFDLYRLEDAEEIYEIGWEEALSDGVLVIEWPERLGPLLPMIRKEIIITPQNAQTRTFDVLNHQAGAKA